MHAALSTREDGSYLSHSKVNYTANGCLAVKAKPHCQLIYSPPICLVILLASAIKVAAIFLAAYVDRHRSPPLLTVGDAIASFLTRPDPSTRNQCWLSSRHIQRKTCQWSWEDSNSSDCTRHTGERLPKPSLWLQAIPTRNWLLTLFVYV